MVVIGLLAAHFGESVAFDGKERQLGNCHWVSHLKRTVCDDASPTSDSHGQISKSRDTVQPAVKLKAGEHCMAPPQAHTNTRGTDQPIARFEICTFLTANDTSLHS